MRSFPCTLLCLGSILVSTLSFQGSTKLLRLPFDLQRKSSSQEWDHTIDVIGNRPYARSRNTLLPPLLSAQDSSVSTSNPTRFDYEAVLKYITAVGVQVGLVALVFSGFDKLVTYYAIKVPTAVNFVLFYVFALKSRIFNPLSNNRPSTKNLEAKDQPKRKMPSFTPPGVVFPIVWLLIIGPIRAAASCMIYNKLGVYASMPILSLMFHLSIGDVWNTINNVERRFGTSVVGVLVVWLSKAYAAYRYYQVVPLAGKMLAGTLIWLTVAAALVAATWRLNPTENGALSPLYPATGEAETQFAWFSKV